MGGRGAAGLELQRSLLLCSVLQRERIYIVALAKPFSSENEELRGRSNTEAARQLS